MDRGREINLTAAVNKDTLTRGLRYSIATGNWGMQGTAGLRAGVSQVLVVSYCAVSTAGETCVSELRHAANRQHAASACCDGRALGGSFHVGRRVQMPCACLANVMLVDWACLPGRGASQKA